jgi:hypothetical protein
MQLTKKNKKRSYTMSQNKTVSNLVRFTVLTAMVTMMMASSAFAQEKVCVNLLVGAGYAAKLSVKVGSLQSPETGSFAIGQQKCIALADLAPAGTSINPGQPIVTTVHAIAGKHKDCTPSPISYDPKRTDNLIYNASGTTLSVHCQQ